MAHGSRNAAAQTAATPNNAHASNGVLTANNASGPAKVNQKKAKRRAKEAAKKQAQAQQAAGDAHVQQNPSLTTMSTSQATSPSNQTSPLQQLDYDEGYDETEGYEGEDFYSDQEQQYQEEYGHPADAPGVNGAGKKNKKKKKKAGADSSIPAMAARRTGPPSSWPTRPASHQLPPPPPPAAALSRTTHHNMRTDDHIWNTSTQQERERIKEFWLALKEEERRSLVKVEKEAVLKKMKEQQKHSCSCTVCGRKRTAIEEELEVLYDAYYEELEQYAEKGVSWPSGLEIPVPPPSTQAPLNTTPNPNTEENSKTTARKTKNKRQQDSRLPPDRMTAIMPPPGQVIEVSDDDEVEYDEEEYSDEDYDDEDDYSDEEPEELPRGPADFFNFGNSLTVKGGILTVADDLLKNDGKKFIEMMEQLAERRMQREEQAQYDAATHPDAYYNRGHGHGGIPEDDEDDDYDDDEYDSQEEYDDEEEDMDTMTEEQRMQEGRRMFQIFAARMFEQRVLTAYREKVAKERQEALMLELEEEEEGNAAKEAKRAKEAEKRKAKNQAKKQKQQEEKAKKEAEKAAQEAAIKAEQERKQEEQRKRKEEQRLKKEEQRKAQEADAARKQAEKVRRQKEEADRRLEAERKQREQKELERKAKEEAKQKERVEREAREKEAKERKAKDVERKEKEAKEKAEQERLRKETQAVQQAQAVQAAKRAAAPPAVPIPPGLTKQPSNYASPHVQPAVPKAPTPSRPRQGSQQGSKGSSPKTPAAMAGQPKSSSPGAIGAPTQPQNAPIAPKQILSRPPSQPPTSSVPQSNISSPMGMQPPPGMPMPQSNAYGAPPGFGGFPNGHNPMMPGNMQRPPMGPGMFSPSQQPIGGPPGFARPFGPPNGMPGPPPGMGAPGLPPFGNQRMPENPPPGFGGQLPGMAGFGGYDTMPARSMPGQHSRQHSGSSGNVEPSQSQAPIGAAAAPGQGRGPRAIGRPSSTKPGDQLKGKFDEADELADHLGSSALLADDDPADDMTADFANRRPSMPVPPGLTSQNHAGSNDLPGLGRPPPGFNNPQQPPQLQSYGIGGPGNTWGTPSIPYGTPSLGGASAGWGGSPTGAGGGWPSNPTFGSHHGLGLNGVSPLSQLSSSRMPLPNMAAPNRAPGRHLQLRVYMIDAYKEIRKAGQVDKDGYVPGKAIYDHTTSKIAAEPKELEELLDTEGTSQNGGGLFSVRDVEGGLLGAGIKWEQSFANAGRAIPHGNIGGGVGEIGSPIMGANQPVGSHGSNGATPFGSIGRSFGGLQGLGGLPGGLSGLGQQ